MAKHKQGKVSGKPKAGLAPPPSPSPFAQPGFGVVKSPTQQFADAIRNAIMNAAPAQQSGNAATPPPPAPVIPQAPALVQPFLTAADLQAINDFNTTYATNLANLDFGVAGLKTDTDFQKSQIQHDAKQASVQTADQMAGRGLFRSSISDAALYDIEAQRALQTKFLDDKLTAATLNAGTQKGLLVTAKTNFDKAMAQKQVENARGINDSNNAAFAEAKTAAEKAFGDWQKKYGGQSAPAPQTTPQVPGAPKPVVVTSKPQVGAGIATPGTPKPNMASGAGALGGPKRGKVVGKPKVGLGIGSAR